jgi:hypothetical protein
LREADNKKGIITIIMDLLKKANNAPGIIKNGAMKFIWGVVIVIILFYGSLTVYGFLVR